MKLRAHLVWAAALTAQFVLAKDTSWVGTASGDWDTVDNWDNGVPAAGDTVTIGNGALTVTLSHATPRLAKLTVGNGTYATVLSTTNWLTCVAADEVEVMAKAKVTCAGWCTATESNRVWIVADTLMVSGTIDADKKGYYGNFSGPAWSGISGADNRHTASYGGKGESPYWDGASTFSKTYGSAEWPYQPGCGRGTTGDKSTLQAGGGAIFLDVANALTVDGTVTASSASGGSGGGIVISCETIVGSGKVLANAGNYTSTGVGGGGRVAVHYDAEKQAAVACRVRFEANGGLYSFEEPPSSTKSYGSSQYHRERFSGDGTVWFTDYRMLTDPERTANGLFLGGIYCSSAALPAKIAWPAGTVANTCNVTLPDCPIEVAGDLTVKSSSAGNYGGFLTGLKTTNCQPVSVTGNLWLENARFELDGGSLAVGGDLTMTNSYNTSQKRAGGALIVRASGSGTTFGASVTAGGTLKVCDGAFVRPYAAPETGEIASFLADRFILATKGLVDARETGYTGGKGPGRCVRSDHTGAAASHGGLGGYVGESYRTAATRVTYGDADHPVTPGSAGDRYSGGNYKYFPGGGAFHLEATHSAAMDGIIDADAGVNTYATHYGSAAGGSVYVKTRALSGEGTIRARGGTSHEGKSSGWALGAPGGGGRISLVATSYADGAALTNNLSASAGFIRTNTTYYATAEHGTVRVSIGSVLTVDERPWRLGDVTPSCGAHAGILDETFAFALSGAVEEEDRTFYYDSESIRRGQFAEAVAYDADGAVLASYDRTNFTHLVAEDTELVWTFTNAQCKITIPKFSNGTVRLNGGEGVTEASAWVATNDTLTLTAVPGGSLMFYRWDGDTNGLDVTTAEISFKGDVPRTLRPRFWNGVREPVTATWVGGSSVYFDDPANWDVAQAPRLGDEVVISSAATTSLKITNATERLARLTVENTTLDGSKTNTLSFLGWDTCLSADDVEIGPYATLQVGSYCTDAVSNRIWISCNRLTVDAKAAVSASGKGFYTYANGPAWEQGKSRHYAHCGSYGGQGTTTYYDDFLNYPIAHPYGSAEWPYDPGCGAGDSNNGLAGGGAIRLEASDSVTVDGIVTAHGDKQCSGGGIVISCRTIAGSGTVRANADSCDSGNVEYGGSGGRVAVHYDAAAQAAVDCRVRFEALGSCSTLREAATSVTGYGSSVFARDLWGEPGTLWFTDWQLVTNAVRCRAGVLLGGVLMTGAAKPEKIVFPSGTVLEKSYLVLSNHTVEAEGGLTVRATGGSGSYGGLSNGLVVRDGSLAVKGDLLLENAKLDLDGSTLTVDGDLIETNSYAKVTTRSGGGLVVRAAATNDPSVAFGAFVTVAGLWKICAGSFVECRVHPKNGAIPGFAAKDFVLDAGGLVDARELGYGFGAYGPGYGYQSSGQGRGGSHGGRSGYNVISDHGITNSSYWAAYGSTRRPFTPGSPGSTYGGNSYKNFPGGSVFHLEAARSATINGTINADGSYNRYATHYTSSAGGSVYVRTIRLSGTGTITARGGMGCTRPSSISTWGVPGCGGGGRISLRADHFDVGDIATFRSEHLSVAAGTVYNDAADTGGAEAGTVFIGPSCGFAVFVR